MGHKGRALAGLLVALLMGLGACGGGNPATPTSQATAVQPSPTASSAVPTKPTSIEPPEKPAAMSTPDEDGAVAAAEYFLRMTTYAAATGDTTELEAMSGPDCQFCESYLESVELSHEDGGWATIPEIIFHKAQKRETYEGSRQFQVELDVTKGAYQYYSPTDGWIDNAAQSLVMIVIVDFTENGLWVIDAVQDLPEGTELREETP